MSKNNEHERIINTLGSLQDVPDRDPKKATRARMQFLRQAKQISEETVSISWLQRLSSVFQAPQRWASTLTITIVLGLLFISLTTSAAAASQALPNQFLYPYKLWLEDQRLALTINPDKEAELHLIYAQERLSELEELSGEASERVVEDLLDNYNQHLDAAEEFISSYQQTSEQEDLFHELETLAPHPSLEPEPEEEESDHELEIEETPEPTSTEEPEETDEPEETEEPETTDQPEENHGPEETPKPESSEEPEETEEPDDPSEPEPTNEEEEEETDEPEETEEP